MIGNEDNWRHIYNKSRELSLVASTMIIIYKIQALYQFKSTSSVSFLNKWKIILLVFPTFKMKMNILKTEGNFHDLSLSPFQNYKLCFYLSFWILEIQWQCHSSQNQDNRKHQLQEIALMLFIIFPWKIYIVLIFNFNSFLKEILNAYKS